MDVISRAGATKPATPSGDPLRQVRRRRNQRDRVGYIDLAIDNCANPPDVATSSVVAAAFFDIFDCPVATDEEGRDIYRATDCMYVVM